MLIERGMTVQGTDAALGSVADVIADREADVFRGIILTHGLLMPKRGFIPADHIVGVTGDVVEVDLSRSDAEKLSAMPVAGAA
jgi:uncharacterized protein YrrD